MSDAAKGSGTDWKASFFKSIDEIERLQACFDQRNTAFIGSCKKNRNLEDQIERLTAESEANAEHARLANKNLALVQSANKSLTAKIERLERELRLEKRTSFALRAEQKNTNDRGVVESIEDVLKQIHWECGREDQTPEKIISTIIDLCNFGLDDELRSASCFSCGKKPCECHRNTNDSGQEADAARRNAVIAGNRALEEAGIAPIDEYSITSNPNQKDSDNG